MIKCTGFTKDPVTGRVVEVQAEADLAPAGKKPPKGILNWVAQPTPGQEPERAEVREGEERGDEEPERAEVRNRTRGKGRGV